MIAERRGRVRPDLAAAVVAAAAALVGCASDSPPPPPRRATAPPRRAPAPPDDAALRAAAEKEAVAVTRQHGLDPSDVHWAPSRKRFALVVPPPPASAGQTDTAGAASILVHPGPGAVPVSIAPVGTLAPTELRFLDEDRLVYLAPPPPVAPAVTAATTTGRRRKRSGQRAARKLRSSAAARGAPPPSAAAKAAYVIQPIATGSPPLLCEGDRFVWTEGRDHVAWVGGPAGKEFVGADGAQVYPRRGRTRTTVQGLPAWSADGRSLAFIETGGGQARLVVLVETDNPNGDSTWPLPPTALRPDQAVFWAGPGRLVVGESLTKPAFATSFEREPAAQEPAAAAATAPPDGSPP